MSTKPEYCKSISPTFPNPMCMQEAEHDLPHKAWNKNGLEIDDWTVPQPEPKPGLRQGDRVIVICEPQRSGGSFSGEWTVVTPASAGSQFLATIEKVDSGHQAKFYEDGLEKVAAQAADQ